MIDVTRPLTVASLFAGIGGFDLGFERAGFEISLQCEINGPCREVLWRHFQGGGSLEHDVRQLRAENFSGGGRDTPDVIVGGFPCQDVSAAGLRAGLDGERSGLWFEYRRILEEVRPRWFVIENVCGLMSSGVEYGRDLGTILRGVGDLGYGFAYRVLDAQWFGVPQRRRRVFIVGCLGDPARAAKVLLEPESGGGDFKEGERAREIASALTANGLGGGGPDDNLGQARHIIPVEDVAFSEQQVAGSMEARGTHGFHDADSAAGGYIVPFRKSTRAHGPDDSETWEPGEVANTLDGGNSTNTSHAIAFNHIQDPVYAEEVALPLGAKSSGGGVASSWGVRRLTPVECERLQGFPDDWTSGHADSVRYKMLGNAVAVPVSTWIAQRIAGAGAR